MADRDDELLEQLTQVAEGKPVEIPPDLLHALEAAHPSRPANAYSPVEDEVIRKFYCRLGATTVSEMLTEHCGRARSEDGVRNRARRLGVVPRKAGHAPWKERGATK